MASLTESIVNELLAELNTPDARHRKSIVNKLGADTTANPKIVKALQDIATGDQDITVAWAASEALHQLKIPIPEGAPLPRGVQKDEGWSCFWIAILIAVVLLIVVMLSPIGWFLIYALACSTPGSCGIGR